MVRLLSFLVLAATQPFLVLQGLSFLAAALLLHMPEEQAFCVLVRVMYHYGLRDLFKVRRRENRPTRRSYPETVPRASAHFFCFFLFFFFCSGWVRDSALAAVPAGPADRGQPGRLVEPPGRDGHRVAHVRVAVVPHALHGQVPALPRLPHSGRVPLPGHGHHLSGQTRVNKPTGVDSLPLKSNQSNPPELKKILLTSYKVIGLTLFSFKMYMCKRRQVRNLCGNERIRKNEIKNRRCAGGVGAVVDGPQGFAGAEL